MVDFFNSFHFNLLNSYFLLKLFFHLYCFPKEFFEIDLFNNNFKKNKVRHIKFKPLYWQSKASVELAVDIGYYYSFYT